MIVYKEMTVVLLHLAWMMPQGHKLEEVPPSLGPAAAEVIIESGVAHG